MPIASASFYSARRAPLISVRYGARSSINDVSQSSVEYSVRPTISNRLHRTVSMVPSRSGSRTAGVKGPNELRAMR